MYLWTMWEMYCETERQPKVMDMGPSMSPKAHALYVCSDTNCGVACVPKVPFLQGPRFLWSYCFGVLHFWGSVFPEVFWFWFQWYLLGLTTAQLKCNFRGAFAWKATSTKHCCNNSRVKSGCTVSYGKLCWQISCTGEQDLGKTVRTLGK